MIPLLLLACVPGFPAPEFPAVPDHDWDGDGYTELEGDCDDREPDIHPGALEICDGLDNDCNRQVDDEDHDVEAPTWYMDADGDGYGRDDDVATSCTAPPGGVSLPGDCDDADPAVHPGADEICGDGIDNDCSGSATCVALLDEVALATFHGSSPKDQLGRSLLAGDLDLDGEADVAVGVWGDDAQSKNEDRDHGLVAVWFGPLSGTSESASAPAIYVGADPGQQAGWSLALAGDVTGDGLPDLLVGGPALDDPDRTPGAWVQPGPLAPGSWDLRDAVALVASPATEAGRSVAAPGDLDGDGEDEILVGAPGTAGGTGTAWLVAGPLAADLDLEADATAAFVGGSPGGEAGWAVAGGADLDGDGLDEIAIGARYDSGAGDRAGAAYVVFGPDVLVGGNLDDLALVLEGEKERDAAGSALALARDLDGDGRADLLVGAEQYDDGEDLDVGAVYGVLGAADLQPGPRSLAEAELVVVGIEVGDTAGFAVAAADLDAPPAGCCTDVVVGARRDSTQGTEAGAVYVLLGPRTGRVPLAAADHDLLGPSAGSRAGEAVAPGPPGPDGLPGLLVGAPDWDVGGGDTKEGAAWWVLLEESQPPG